MVLTVAPGGLWADEGRDGWTLSAEPAAPVVQDEQRVVATEKGAIVVTLPG